jgi:replication initiation protein RepC
MRTGSTGGRRLTLAALASTEIPLPKPSAAITRKDMSAAARDCMKALKLRPTLRLVLGELTGCWGEQEFDGRIMVWPSNEYLIARTGLSERAVRYGIRGLVELQLITPKDSANGKRFVRRKEGRIIDAYGFDLRPVYARRNEWTETLDSQERFTEMQRACFEEITVCRRAAEEALSSLAIHYPGADRAEIEQMIEEARSQTPRRSAKIPQEVLDHVLSKWQRTRETAERTFYQAGFGGTSCRHIESNPNPAIMIDCKEGIRKDAEVGESPSLDPIAPSLKLITEALPVISQYYPKPILKDTDVIAAGAYLRPSIGASPDSWHEALARLGPLRAAILVLITLQIAEDEARLADEGKKAKLIRSPGGYFRTLVRLAAQPHPNGGGRFNMEIELMRLRRIHLE